MNPVSSMTDQELMDDQDPDIGQAGPSRRSVMGWGALTPVAAGVLGTITSATQPAAAVPAGPAIAMALTINGGRRQFSADLRTTLLDALREKVGLNGSKKGCDHGQCSACTVHVGATRSELPDASCVRTARANLYH